MQLLELELNGCFIVRPGSIDDERGNFRKVFHEPTFTANGLESEFKESYVTTSHLGVIRGMHFQTPPFDHAKLVCCLTGSAQDALVDLRKGSPTFGKSISLRLTEEESEILYIPRGIAHGFAALQDQTRMWYMVTSAYNPNADSGVRWDSIGVNWQIETLGSVEPIISTRDRSFLPLDEFETPFRFQG